ncbi:hypothetical protein SGPA1_40923 [Streptomyces misionensis JCM 4497]
MPGRTADPRHRRGRLRRTGPHRGDRPPGGRPGHPAPGLARSRPGNGPVDPGHCARPGRRLPLGHAPPDLRRHLPRLLQYREHPGRLRGTPARDRPPRALPAELLRDPGDQRRPHDQPPAAPRPASGLRRRARRPRPGPHGPRPRPLGGGTHGSDRGRHPARRRAAAPAGNHRGPGTGRRVDGRRPAVLRRPPPLGEGTDHHPPTLTTAHCPRRPVSRVSPTGPERGERDDRLEATPRLDRQVVRRAPCAPTAPGTRPPGR